MKKSLTTCLAVFALIVLASCSRGNTTEGMPGITIPLSDYNTKFVMILYPGTPNSIKNGDVAGFILKNQSSSSIVFLKGYGVKVFEKETQGWRLVENRYGYGDVESLLENNITNPGGLIFEAAPYDPNLKNPVTVRIVVAGHLQDKPNEAVGAYIDMEMHP